MSRIIDYLIKKQVESEVDGNEVVKLKLSDICNASGSNELEVEDTLLELVNSGKAQVEIDNNLDMILKYRIDPGGLD